MARSRQLTHGHLTHRCCIIPSISKKEFDSSRSKMEFRSELGETVKTRMLETIAAAVEVTAGLALIADPAFVVRLPIGPAFQSAAWR